MDFILQNPRFTLDPVADAEEKLRQAMLARSQVVPAAPAAAETTSFLPRTRKVSAGGTVTNNAKPEEELGSGRAMLAQALKLYSSGPDVSALNEYAQQRAKEGDSSMLNALAAQFAGDDFAPVQGQYLKRAMAAQEPMKFGNYGYVAGGKFVADPYAQRDTQGDALINIGGKLLDNEEAAMREARLAARMTQQSRSFQQGGPVALSDGRVVQAVFDPSSGQYVYNTPQGRQPVPADARPATASMGGPLGANQFNTLETNLFREDQGLKALDRYYTTNEFRNQGFGLLADQLSANFKTLFNGGLSPQELAAQLAQGQLQGLVGLTKDTVVGGGVMTEQDAQRVIQYLGGDVNALTNKQRVEEALKYVFEEKKRTADFMRQQLQRSAPFYGVYGYQGAAPQNIGGSQPLGSAASGSSKVVVDY